MPHKFEPEGEVFKSSTRRISPGNCRLSRMLSTN